LLSEGLRHAAAPRERLTVRTYSIHRCGTGQESWHQGAVTPHVLRHTLRIHASHERRGYQTRAKMLGHSIETAYGMARPGMKEIEKAAALLDDAEAA